MQDHRHPPLRGVTIGAGYFSHIQMASWKRVADAHILAICDLDAAKVRRFAEEHGIPKTYADVHEMLDKERPDFIDIVTRPESHLELTLAAADRGIHVLCQKPLAPTYEDAEKLVMYCQQQGVRLMVNENWRWQAWYREIKKILDQGVIGKPFYARFFTRRGDGRGDQPFARQPYFRDMPRFLLYETICHFIDTARYLWGEIDSIFSVHRRIHPEIVGEDFTLTTLTMENGMTVFIDANRYTEPEPSADPRTFGVLSVEGREGKLDLLTNADIRISPIGSQSYIHSYHLPTAGYFGDSCRATQQHFVDCLLSGEPFETSGQDYLHTFQVVFAGYESAETGRSVVPSHISGANG